MIELQECIDKLSSEDEADRIYAAEDIGYANRPEGVPPLLARLADEPSRAAREAIFGALLQIEDDSVVEGAIRLLDSDDPFLRNQSVVILRTRGARAIPYLERAYSAGDKDRRKFVLDVLAKLSEPGASGIYTLALQDEDPNVVITAVENIGVMRHTAFRAAIEQMLDPAAHPMLLGACLESLTQIGNTASLEIVRRSLMAGRSLPGFLEASYLRLLGAHGERPDIAEVAAFSSHTGVEGHVLNALTALHSRFRDEPLPLSLIQPLKALVGAGASPVIAYQAVRLLGGLLPAPEVFEFLCACLENSEKAVRIAAVQALRESASGDAEAALRQRLSREADEEVLQALKR